MSHNATMRNAEGGTERSFVNVEEAAPGVLLATFDSGPEGAPFVITPEVLDEVEALRSRVAETPGLEALLFRNRDEKVFCAGADVDAMARIRSQAEAEALIRKGQECFQRIAELRVPTVALIQGTCVGGGLELALACSARTAVPDTATRLGLPETKLGIIPAWGGSTRLPRLIGLEQSIGLITAGRTVNAWRALKLGLVDSLVPREHLVREGIALARRCREDAWKRGPRGLRVFLLEKNPLGRALLGRMAAKAVHRATRGHYPAPAAALRVLIEGRALPLREAFEVECKAVLPLISGSVHKNLLRLFQITRPKRRPPVYASGADAPGIAEAVVVGAGVMGSGIAALLATRGVSVRVIDPAPEALSRAWKLIQREVHRRVRRRDLDRAEGARRLARVTMATEIGGLRLADLVIEAATEKRELKEDILARIAAGAPPEALIATNTSSIPIGELARRVSGPGRFLGLHFFNPPLKMPLLEIVRGPATEDAAVARGLAVAGRLGKTPVVVGDAPGFLVNRLLMPYLLEACRLAEGGLDIETIDRALLDFGMPMGPFRLMDEVGLDVVAHAGSVMVRDAGEGRGLHPFIDGLVAAGKLGKKTGEGFYTYGRKRKPGPMFRRIVSGASRKEAAASASGAGIAERLIGCMLEEAEKALAEGIALCPEDVDIATVFGIGFPAFRGGLMHDAETRGKGAAE